MANLLGSNIGINYKSILNLDATTINTPLDATLRAVTDGMGNVSPLRLSTDQVGVTRAIALSTGATNPRLFNEVYTINNVGAQTGTITGIFLNATETALNGMTHNLMDLQVGGVSKFKVSNTGVTSNSSNGNAIVGVSETGIGVNGSSNTSTGVSGVSDAGTGVVGSSNTNTGVVGISETGTGVKGISNNGNAVYASSQNGNGIYASSFASIGAFGVSQTDIGVAGVSNESFGGYFSSNLSYSVVAVQSAAKPGGGSWSAYSDLRVKKNIKPYLKGLNEILLINPVNYEYNGLANTIEGIEYTGIIAQEIKDIFPETINTYKEKLNIEDIEKTELYDFNSTALTFALINAVKELKAEIELLKAK